MSKACVSTTSANMESSGPKSKITVGAGSKPMKEILKRLRVQKAIDIVIFADKQILEESVDEWPVCDAFIAFYSSGFPLEKAIKYAELRKPFVVNDLPSQYLTRDRREVYRVLSESNIETPRYTIMNRDEGSKCVLNEEEDWVEIDNVMFQKPFVEKPVDAEDHNVYIYYPTGAGGGSQRLFRKVGDKSSEYSSEVHVRKTGSFIYEDFMPTDGTDVKVYTVGPHYAHAEARKCPALDGRVERDSGGKEIRYPIILTAREKEIARQVCLAFKQTVCGFDLLRANGKSYVCDVNGFSFVKTSKKYYDDCAQILSEMLLSNLAPHLVMQTSPLANLPSKAVVPLPTPTAQEVELRCIVAIIRHGDRTPKQKLKMEVYHEKFFNLFEHHGGKRKGRLKLKRPSHLQEVLDIVRSLLSQADGAEDGDCMFCEDHNKLMQVKAVLEMYNSFSGINRKVQFRYVKSPSRPSSAVIHNLSPGGIETDEIKHEHRLLLILKWGGELTRVGGEQAQKLGQTFRCMYPEETGEYGSLPGLGFLRLHSTYRHDLKIYAADEGRVQTTAAAFLKGLLALEGQLAPILVSLVNCDKTNNMLDSSNYAANIMDRVKARLHDLLRKDEEFDTEEIEQLVPTGWKSLKRSIEKVNNPFQACCRIHKLVQSVTQHVKQWVEEQGPDLPIYHGETLLQMARRWEKLEKDFYNSKTGLFDISKVPDIYDCVKYDLLHNEIVAIDLEGAAEELHDVVNALADIVVPQEYGMTEVEKLEISQLICSPLLRKMRTDFKRNVLDDETFHQLNTTYCDDVNLMSSRGHVRTRLYFTSESHIHSVLNALRLGGLFGGEYDNQWEQAQEILSSVSEFNYMTQLVFRLYEDKSKSLESPHRFVIEILFSPGAYGYREANDQNPHHQQSVSKDHQMASGSGTHSMQLHVPASLSSSIRNLHMSPSPSIRSTTPLSRDVSPEDGDQTTEASPNDRQGSPQVTWTENRLKSRTTGYGFDEIVTGKPLQKISEIVGDPVFRVSRDETKADLSHGLKSGLGMVSSIQLLTTLHKGVPLTQMDQLLGRIALENWQMQEFANQSPLVTIKNDSHSSSN